MNCFCNRELPAGHRCIRCGLLAEDLIEPKRVEPAKRTKDAKGVERSAAPVMETRVEAPEGSAKRS